jgi:hypothetical protein
MTKFHLATRDACDEPEVPDDEDEKSKIITKTRLGNFQGQTDHPPSKTMKSYANNRKRSQEFIDKSQNQCLKISLAAFSFLSAGTNVEDFDIYILHQREQAKRMIIKY